MTIWNRLAKRLSSARRDQRGAVAVQFALLLLPIAILTFGLIDISRTSLQKRQLQDALDASTLMAARSTATTNADLDTIGDAALATELSGLGVTLTPASSTFSIDGTTITGTVSVTIKPIVSNLWTNKDITISAQTKVVRASKDVEVSLVLDTTGSMSGTRIADLKTAAADLVDQVVRDAQTPYYSRIALVPYAAGVNVGAAYADAVRGPVPVRVITGASWAKQSSSTITKITRSSTNATITTSTAHNLVANDRVYIAGISGMVDLNGKNYNVTSVSGLTFTIGGVSSSYSAYKSAGTATECRTTTCSVVVTTSVAHGFINGDLITIANVAGMTQLNGQTPTISTLTTTTFDTHLVGVGYGAYSSGGTATCTTSTVSGCTNYTFTSAAGGSQTLGISTCVSERVGLDAYTDVAPSTSLVGRNYPASNNPCPVGMITPLTSDKTLLKGEIAKVTASGSTAGQIGLGWGWYMISPNYGYLWPTATQKPAIYGKKDLMKVLILMTDGAFNTQYCNGVIAKDAGSGSGNDSDHINCNATNGNGFAQTNTLCTNIKAKGVIIYTVGFDVGDDATATAMLRACATDPDHVFFPADGAALKTAFHAIGQDISSLRIAQ
jgi:Flp pilus assembly protein TadG